MLDGRDGSRRAGRTRIHAHRNEEHIQLARLVLFAQLVRQEIRHVEGIVIDVVAYRVRTLRQRTEQRTGVGRHFIVGEETLHILLFDQQHIIGRLQPRVARDVGR